MEFVNMKPDEIENNMMSCNGTGKFSMQSNTDLQPISSLLIGTPRPPSSYGTTFEEHLEHYINNITSSN